MAHGQKLMPLWLASASLYVTTVVYLAVSGPVGKGGWLFGLAYLAAFACLTGMVRYWPFTQGAFVDVGVVLVVGICARIFFLWFPPSDDLFRYIWEGYIQLHGFNPYSVAPDSPLVRELASKGLPGIWARVNHPDFTAIYPPLTQLTFRLLASIRPDPFLFKATMALADMGALVCLVFFWKIRKYPYKRLLWYAGNPLLLVFLAGEGHLDSLMLFWLCLALAFLAARKEGVAFLCLGCAAMTKYWVVLAVPFFMTCRNWKKGGLALVPLAAFAPYLDDPQHLFTSLTRFGLTLHYNDSLTALLRLVIGDWSTIAAICIFGLGLGLIYLVVHDPLRSLFYGFGLLLICLPTLHPWYLALISPFAAAFGSPAWLLLQATVVSTFPVLINDYHSGIFQEIQWLKLFEYGPFFGLLAWELRTGFTQAGRGFKPVKTMSVVIPTLNEAAHIRACLTTLWESATICQVVVVDGGSKDETVGEARRFGAEVVRASPGRGSQICKGLENALGDVVLVLHADCRLKKGVAGDIIERLNTDGTVAGGGVAMTFTPGSYRLRIIALLNNLRAGFSGICFGDQAQFFRQEALALMGGFPNQMLMEDVELSLRLKAVGKVILLKRGVSVQGRRWTVGGFWGKLITVLRLFTGYLVQRRLGCRVGDAKGYYQAYYGQSAKG